MLKIKIHCIGKNKDKFIDSSIAEFCKRTSHDLEIQWFYHKDDKKLLLKLKIEKNPLIILLDEHGQEMNSPQFSSFIFNHQSQQVHFILGECFGFSPDILKLKSSKLSLSKLTFTYQHARLLLAEQLYRAQQIYIKSSYHKEGP